jgi:hypothetical protein
MRLQIIPVSHLKSFSHLVKNSEAPFIGYAVNQLQEKLCGWSAVFQPQPFVSSHETQLRRIISSRND